MNKPTFDKYAETYTRILDKSLPASLNEDISLLHIKCP